MRMSFPLIAVLLFSAASVVSARAQAICDDGYALCMSGCATDRSPERCMQRCQEAERRCAKSGVFKMPVGFLLNKNRLQDMSHAEGQLPQQGRNKRR
jgi:hypothetical protein